MTDREVVNLIYRHNLWLKHSDKSRLQDELEAAGKIIAPARAISAKPITAGYVVQLLVSHLLQAGPVMSIGNVSTWISIWSLTKVFLKTLILENW